jgi:MFS family permease
MEDAGDSAGEAGSSAEAAARGFAGLRGPAWLARRLSGEGGRPPFFYGWVMLGVTTLTTIATMPGQSVIVGGAFSEAIRSDLGMSLSTFSAAYLVATFCASLPLTYVGKLSDRFGTRAVMGGVGLCFGGACVLAGFAFEIVSLTVAFFLLRFLGQGALGLVSSHALAMWYERKLGFAEAIRHLGMPTAVAVLPALTLLLIEAVGWRVAYGMYGAAVLAIVLPLVVFAYVNRPEDIGQRLDGDREDPRRRGRGARAASEGPRDLPDIEIDAPSVGDAGHISPGDAAERDQDGIARPVAFTLRQAVRTPAYWIVTASMMLSAAVGTAFVFHAQPMMADLGFDPGFGAVVISTLGVVSAIVTIPFGWIVDRVRPGPLVALTTVGLGLACLCYAYAAASAAPALLAHGAYLFLGLSQGMLFLMASPIFARFYGRPHHGAIRGSLTTFMVVGTSAGPLVFSVGRDLSGAFVEPYYWAAAVCVPLACAGLALRPPPVPN